MTDTGWKWRNCREFGIEIGFWVCWPWNIGTRREEDFYGGSRWLYLGPLTVRVSYSSE